MHSPSFARRLTEDDLDAIAEFYAAQARESFWAFRRFMDPDLVQGWFPRELAIKLQLFYDRLIAGKRPKLVIVAPPQHGKSRGLHDFAGWVAGKAPDIKQIYASFSSDLGTGANAAMQKMLDDPRYHLVFPKTTISRANVVTGANRAKRNSRLIEFQGYKGSFRNTTVNGQITGKTLGLGTIDDPIKGRAEASSKTMRDKAWNWFMDDFFTRFTNEAGMILTATRWHVDDPTGRFIEKFPDAIVLTYPALSTKDNSRRYDIRRGIDEPLFPEFKDFSFLMERKTSGTIASWESLYQGSPIVTGGGIFPVDRIKVAKALPDKKQITKSIRYWDKAGTTDGGAFTAGVLMHLLKEGGWLISDVVRGQWSAFERERKIMATTERDEGLLGKFGFDVWVEQEPGSGGLESAERTIAMLAGYKVYKDKVTGKKEIRADPYAAQWQGGNISIYEAKWNDAFLDEHESFPNSQYKDQVDAAGGAFTKLVKKQYAYDTSMRWVGAMNAN
jgi:predicted phage terminase large subunit-like protein